MKDSTLRLLLLAIVVGTLLKGLWWAVALPRYSGPDEVEHIDYLRHLIVERQYPVYGVTRFFDYGPLPDAVRTYAARYRGLSAEAFQPPLGYSLASLFAPNGAQLSAVALLTFGRTLSVLLSVGILLLAFGAARMLLPADPLFAIAVAGLVSLQPTLTYVTSTFNNDAPAAFLGTAIVFWLVHVLVRRQQRVSDAVILGGLFGLGLLTKQHLLLFFFPIALVAFWTRKSWISLLGRLSLMTVTTVFVSGWWYVRSLVTYGDWLGLPSLGATSLFSGQPFAALAPLSFLLLWPGFWIAMVRSWFAFYGYAVLPKMWISDGLLAGIVLLGFLGLLITLGRLTVSIINRSSRLDRPQERLLLLSIVLLGLFLASFIAYTFLWDIQPAGRWFLPLVLPISFLVLAGLWPFIRRRHRAIFTVGLFALFLAFHHLALTFLVKGFVAP